MVWMVVLVVLHRRKDLPRAMDVRALGTDPSVLKLSLLALTREMPNRTPKPQHCEVK
jgi:hypothetical protein